MKSVTVLLMLVLMCLLIGCGEDAQSGEAIYAQSINCVLYTGIPKYNDWRMDIYHGPETPDDKEWWNMAFVLGTYLKDFNKEWMRRDGIRVDASISFHGTYMDHVGSDVFNPVDGRGYIDFIGGIEGTTIRDGRKWYYARTNNNGEIYLIIGIGDPGFNTNPNHTGNPELYIMEDDWISTIIEVELRVFQKNGSEHFIATSVYAVITKTGLQKFWYDGYVPGVFDVSFSGLGTFSRPTGLNEGISPILEIEDLSASSSIFSMDKSPSLPPLGFKAGGSVVSEFDSGVIGATSSSLNFTINDAYWMQLIFIDGSGWEWVDAFPSSFAPYIFLDGDIPWQGEEKPCTDPNSTDMKLQRIIDRCQPVVHALDISFDQPVEPGYATCVLRTLDHEEHFYPDPNYWPEEESARLADFNQDGRINFTDFGILAANWLDVWDHGDPNDTPPAIDIDGNEATDTFELTYMTEHWLQNNDEYTDITDPDNAITARPFYYMTGAYTEDYKRHLLITPFIIQVNDELFDGRFVDSWENPVYLIYSPPGSFMDLRPVIGGDYNGDRITNLQDYAIFSNLWQSNTMDPAFDLNNDGLIDNSDFQLWMPNWLKEN